MPEMLAVKVRRLAHAHGLDSPVYGSAEAAGADLRAAIDTPMVLAPRVPVAVPTGLVLEIPAGYEMQVRPRSGLALKRGVTVVNAPGTVDSDYRGEVMVALINLCDAPATIEPGERIAQAVFAPVIRAVFSESETLNETTRGAGGFGSTGRS